MPKSPSSSRSPTPLPESGKFGFSEFLQAWKVAISEANWSWLGRRQTRQTFAVFTAVSLFLLISTFKPTEFCGSGVDEDWCVPCPEHATCEKKTFQCAYGTIQTKYKCLQVEKLTLRDIEKLHKKLVRLVKKEGLTDVETIIMRAKTKWPVSDVDFVAALQYGDDYFIESVVGRRTGYLRNPGDVNNVLVWFMSILGVSGLVASIIMNKGDGET